MKNDNSSLKKQSSKGNLNNNKIFYNKFLTI